MTPLSALQARIRSSAAAYTTHHTNTRSSGGSSSSGGSGGSSSSSGNSSSSRAFQSGGGMAPEADGKAQGSDAAAAARPPIKALLFDLDGTLYPTANGYVEHVRGNLFRYMEGESRTIGTFVAKFLYFAKYSCFCSLPSTSGPDRASHYYDANNSLIHAERFRAACAFHHTTNICSCCRGHSQRHSLLATRPCVCL
jgi:hypothetical protein